jgi:ABC-type glycerol-3-phosphate transport system substrate-binding protein
MEREKGLQYRKAERGLRNIIRELKTSNTSLLPPEPDLIDKLEVSRNTFRRVMGDLAEEGVIQRIQGKGTFIVPDWKKIAFSGWVKNDPGGDVIIDRMVNGFKLQRGIEVNYISFPFYQYPHQLFSLITNGNAPDVLQINPYWLPRFQSLDLLMPLDHVITPNNLHRRFTSDIESCRIGNELYALNWSLCPLVLFYNKRVMERSGLDPEHPPGTLEELRELSIRVNRSKEQHTYGFCLPLALNEPHFHWLLPFLLAFRGGYSDKIGNLIIDCEENVKAMEWMIDFYSQGGVSEPKRPSDARILFATDHVAFLVDGPYARGFFRQMSGRGKEFDGHYGVATIPTGPTGRSESILLAHSLSIPRRCRHPELAREWIEYLTTNEQNARLYFEEYGMIPCLRDLLHKPYYMNDPFASVIIKQLDTASLVPIRHPLFSRSLPFLTHLFSDMIRYRQKPAERLRFLREIINILGQSDEFVASVM